MTVNTREGNKKVLIAGIVLLVIGVGVAVANAFNPMFNVGLMAGVVALFAGGAILVAIGMKPKASKRVAGQ